MLSAFRDLSVAGARRASLREFVHGLSRHDIRELCALVDVQDFRFDILGNLPAEVVFIVIRHLDLATLFRCQCVSRRWKEVLGSNEIINETLNSWNKRGECKLVMCDTSPAATANTKSEHIDAFCTGKAFSKITGACSCDYHRRWHLPTMAYCDGHLAWMNAEMNCTRLRNLHTGKQMCFKEEVMTIAMSASLIVCVSRLDECYITRLSDFKKDCVLSVPSTRILRVVVSTGIVAMLFEPWKEPTVITWDSKSRTQTSFIVDLGSCSNRNEDCIVRADILIPASEQHVVIILSEFRNGAPCTESYTSTCYTLAGTIISRHTTSHKRWATHPIKLSSVNPRPCDAVGTYTIFAYTYPEHSRSGTSRPARDRNLASIIVQVTYSTLTDQISITTYPPSNISFASTFTSPHVPTNLFFYKSIAYGYLRPLNRSIPSLSSTVNTLHVFNLNAGTCHPAPMDLIATEGDPNPMSPRIKSHDDRVLGDERFVVAICEDGFKAWCFDKNVRMEGEDGEYRNRREGGRRWMSRCLRQLGDGEGVGGQEG